MKIQLLFGAMLPELFHAAQDFQHKAESRKSQKKKKNVRKRRHSPVRKSQYGIM